MWLSASRGSITGVQVGLPGRSCSASCRSSGGVPQQPWGMDGFIPAVSPPLMPFWPSRRFFELPRKLLIVSSFFFL